LISDAIGQVLSFAVAAGLSPIPIVGVVLMLGSPRGRSNGLAFVAGWVVSILVLGGVVLAVAGGAGADDSVQGPAYLKLALGVLLLFIALRQWRGRPKEREQPEPPKWMAAIATLGVGVPVAMYFVMGERSKDLLDDLKRWMANNNGAIMAAICAVIGAKLIGDAISGLGG
jgi:peptidoglycan/LPS O-acetylase OafA/YrhL